MYEWLVDRIWPDTDLLALRLDRDSGTGSAASNGLKPRELLRDERFRRAIGVNQHGGSEWFNKERFEHSLDVLGLARKADLKRAADKSHYRVDAFEKELAAPPTWASTGPTRATTATGAPARPGKTKPDSTTPVKPARRQSRADGG